MNPHIHTVRKTIEFRRGGPLGAVVALTLLALALALMAFAGPASASDEIVASSIQHGPNHTCAVRESGQAVCWGSNGFGQLGDGTTTDRPAPVLVSGLDDAASIAPGSFHTCAVRTSGQAVCWGFNGFSQLGDRSNDARLAPVPVFDLADAKAITAGGKHTCAVRISGEAVCWGYNFRGRLGDGTRLDRSEPTPVVDLADAKSIAAGREHTCAVRSSGETVCWGRNEFDQLGDGTGEESEIPAPVPGLEDAREIAARAFHTCAIRDSGLETCWGRNYGKVDAAAWMFSPYEVSKIRMQLDPDERAKLQAEPFKWVPVTFSMTGSEGRTYGPIEAKLRLKGHSSFRPLSGKAAMKLKFNKGTGPWGLRKLTLNNQVQDRSKVREATTYEVFRALGIPAPRTGYAEVELDGAGYGLYLNVETMDGTALSRWHETTQHLYEGENGADLLPGDEWMFDVDEGDEDDISDLETLIAAVNNPAETWFEELMDVMDVHQMTRMWAAEAFLGQWDGYVYNANNYYLHNDGEKFTWMPWGADQALSGKGFKYFLVDDSRSLNRKRPPVKRCLAHPVCRPMYADSLQRVRTVSEALGSRDSSRALFDFLYPYIEADPKRGGASLERAEIEADRISTYLLEQSDQLDQAQVAVPAAPRGVAAGLIDRGLNVTWIEALTDGVNPVTGYTARYRLDGGGDWTEVTLDDPSARHLRLFPLQSGGSYELRVNAESAAGRGATAFIYGLFVPDSRQPAPGITAGPSESTDDEDAVFGFQGEDGARFECRLDGSVWRDCVSPEEYEQVSAGSHTFAVRQVDAAGNTSAPTERSWIRSDTAPILALNKTGDGGGQIEADPAGPYSWGDEVTITASPAQGSTFTGFTGCVADGNTCIVSMKGDSTVTAEFQLIPQKARFTKLKVQPNRRVLRRGKSAVIRVKLKNAGNARAKQVRVCVKAPKRLVRVKRCFKLGQLASKEAKMRKFRVKVKPNAGRGKRAVLRFRATGRGVKPVAARAVVRVR